MVHGLILTFGNKELIKWEESIQLLLRYFGQWSGCYFDLIVLCWEWENYNKVKFWEWFYLLSHTTKMKNDNLKVSVWLE